MNPNPRRIDVHHHFLPPEYLAELKRQGANWTGGPAIPEWNLSIARETMERNGIDVAIASVVPQVFWGDAKFAAHWARHSNEFVARAVHDDPRRFGGFATLPLPDVAASLRELEYALDVLKLDGVILFSSAGVQYLGDPAYEELFQELERRKAVVLIHPTTVPPGATVPRLSLPWGLVEFIADTTRAVTNLLYNGVLERYPSIRYIVSHAGGAVPYLALRLTLGNELPGKRPEDSNAHLRSLQRLYYDTTLSTSEPVFAALRQFVPTSQILFGSDYPLVHEGVVKMETKALESSKVLDDTVRRAINRENALALFPRFASS